MDCVFCRIVSGNIKPEIISESTHFLVFLDANPITEGHTIICSKRHVSTFMELNDDEAKDLGLLQRDISKKLKEKLDCDITIANSSGKWASQSIDHFHVHIIPRKEGDRLWDGEKSKVVLDRSSDFERLKPSGIELQSIANKIRGE
ncbi:HIT family protein [Candidatus Micrarchaeota archaeon]|jgi:histidine triad (HIT) family protein|nr:HIT family protein [Candidatus Micrarchaeota archaeon]